VNSQAGAVHGKAEAEELRRIASETGLDATVMETESSEVMEKMVRRLVDENAPLIAIAGGDGTVSCAVQHLVHTETALGILPQGTANNFATALRLPMDLPSSIRVLKEGTVREVDLGKAANRYFTESAGVGLFADSLAWYGAGSNKNFVRGLYAMVRVFLSLKSRRMRLTVDGKIHSERAVMCTVANTYRMAKGVPVAPEASASDGILDVVIIGDLHRREIISYYRAFRSRKQHSLPKVTNLRAKEIRIESAVGMNVHCDDKVIGMTPVSISVVPKALKVMVGE